MGNFIFLRNFLFDLFINKHYGEEDKR